MTAPFQESERYAALNRTHYRDAQPAHGWRHPETGQVFGVGELERPKQGARNVKELLTHSRQDAFKTCRKRHYFAYELGLRRIDDARALRMGSAFHEGIEAIGKGKGLAAACDAVRAKYSRCPVFIDASEWNYERETVLRLVCAYDWRWKDAPMEYVAVELQFELPLVNPATGKKSSLFNLGGKIDAIVKLEDGRMAVKESKLLGDDIGPDSDLWRRMRMDHQISLYMLAARQLGYAVDTVLYDVTRKPTIAPTLTPVLDELGAKIVVNQFGDRVKTDRGQWRQTGDKDRQWTLKTRPMLTEEWGEKLSSDIAERPEYYFARVEVPRMDQDLAEYQAELWEIQQLIRDAQKNNRHFRTVNKNTCGYCPYFNICSGGSPFNGTPPEGFELVVDRHPELERTHVNGSTAKTPSPSTPTAGSPEFTEQSYW